MYRLRHIAHKGFDVGDGGGAVLGKEFDDGAANDGTIADFGHGGGLLRGGNAIAAGAHDIQYLKAGMLHRGGVVPHGGGTAGNFINRFGLGAFGGKRRQERRVLGGACLPAHDLVHDLIGFVIGQVLFMNNIQVCAKEIVNNEIIFV